MTMQPSWFYHFLSLWKNQQKIDQKFDENGENQPLFWTFLSFSQNKKCGKTWPTTKAWFSLAKIVTETTETRVNLLFAT